MARTKEEIRKLFEARLQEDSLANQSLRALKQCLAHLDTNTGATVGAVGCFFLLHFAGSKQLTILLAEEGWFSALDTTYGMEREIYHLTMAGEITKVDRLLVDMYLKKLKGVEKKITSAFPKRKELIKQAFWAHNKRRYDLSIPLFLSQSDGISMDITNGEYFLKDKGRPRTAKFVDSKILNPIFSQLFELLRINLPISASKDQRKKQHVNFNRHAILHGEDLHYGTKLNSFKAISLLSYLSSLNEILEPAKEPMEILHQLLKMGQDN
ncbi:MAG: hypothetical protein HY800_03330 [Ignavibacteriales bacterium]|nr:hypothetical protein [Ignavibacteriales bacterium]